MNVQFDRKERLMQILEQDDFDKDQLVAAILAAFGHSTVKTLSVVEFFSWSSVECNLISIQILNIVQG